MMGMVQSPSPHGCLYCQVKGHLTGAGKCVFCGFWRWLPPNHAGRTAAAVKVNPRIGAGRPAVDKQEQAPAPRVLHQQRPGSRYLALLGTSGTDQGPATGALQQQPNVNATARGSASRPRQQGVKVTKLAKRVTAAVAGAAANGTGGRRWGSKVMTICLCVLPLLLLIQIQTSRAPARKATRGVARRHLGRAEALAKECVLWCLPYWWNLGPTNLSSYDPMHTISGVVEDCFGLIGPNPQRLKPAIRDYEMKYNG